MSLKRSVRLKEYSPFTKFIRIPPKSYYITRPRFSKNKFYYFHTDNNGYIYNTVDKMYSKDLILLGDSSVENLFVDADKRVIAYLENFLISLGLDYNIKNSSVSGASLLHITNIILNKIAKNKDSTLFLFIPSNDSSILNLKDTYWNIDKLNSNLIGIENKTLFSENKDEVQNFGNILKTLIGICKIFSIELYVFSIIRFKEKVNYKVLDKLAEEICKENNIVYSNINFLLQNEKYFYDDVHLNEDGSYELANILRGFCEKNLRPTLTNSYKIKSSSTDEKKVFDFLNFKNIINLKEFNVNSVDNDVEYYGFLYGDSLNTNVLDGIHIASKVYSKYDTFLVFNKNKNCLELEKMEKNRENKYVIHIKNNIFYFVEDGKFLYINEINDKSVVYGDIDISLNYTVENNQNYINVIVDNLYLSASNLMNLKFVNHKKACEFFHYYDF